VFWCSQPELPLGSCRYHCKAYSCSVVSSYGYHLQEKLVIFSDTKEVLLLKGNLTVLQYIHNNTLHLSQLQASSIHSPTSHPVFVMNHFYTIFKNCPSLDFPLRSSDHFYICFPFLSCMLHTSSFGGEVNRSVRCRRLAACKRTLHSMSEMLHPQNFSNPVSHTWFSCFATRWCWLLNQDD
jgi:hypothetical protein